MSSPAIHLRSYSRPTGLDRHDYAQWVIPLHGDLEFELGGRGNRLGQLQGAFVAAGELHDESGVADDTVLILDCPPPRLDDVTHETLRQRRWLALPADAKRRLPPLVARGDAEGLLSLLLLHFAPESRTTRLHTLCSRIDACPDAMWTVERMALEVGVSVSRLHALFVGYFGRSPQAWLTACRLQRVKHALAYTSHTIADIAQAAGYSEHSALTRAFRRELGMSPAEWRRGQQ
ncbi:MAG: AraC family transcriptional regulator [Luteibacter sp.]|uniref:helix-turn-helix transcriptional regulator n=1 Tax=Luteibacter TaxID=242605 RepID=UPI000563AFCC|nr:MULTISPECIES: AraC family transcriptional regulator [unclassified Luteibacter]MDQ7994775.1 AraC family transcriptional regulator [Luteibacter sp.]